MTTTRRLSLAYLALTAGVAVLFALNLFWGSVSLTPGAVAAALLGRGEDALAVGIVLQLRLPRAVMVVLLGAALSAAGYLLQTFFANPIAGPFVMGVSSGAKLAVALTMVVFLDRGMLTSSATMIAAAFAGAMAAMAFVLSVARRVHRMSILVICGVMIGFICGFVGAGGGMMMLLILTSVLGYELKTAVGTSVFIMAFTALTGAVSHFAIGGMPDPLTWVLCVIFTLIWARIAAVFANKAQPKTLNRATGIVLVVLGAVIMGFQLLHK